MGEATGPLPAITETAVLTALTQQAIAEFRWAQELYREMLRHGARPPVEVMEHSSRIAELDKALRKSAMFRKAGPALSAAPLAAVPAAGPRHRKSRSSRQPGAGQLELVAPPDAPPGPQGPRWAGMAAFGAGLGLRGVWAAHKVTAAKLAFATGMTAAVASGTAAAVITTRTAPYATVAAPPAHLSSAPAPAPSLPHLASAARHYHGRHRRPGPAAEAFPSGAPSSPAPSRPAASPGTLRVQEVSVTIGPSGTGQLTFTAIGGTVDWSVSASWQQAGAAPVLFSTDGNTAAAQVSGTALAGHPVTVTVTVPPGTPAGSAVIGVDGTQVPVSWN